MPRKWNTESQKCYVRINDHNMSKVFFYWTLCTSINVNFQNTCNIKVDGSEYFFETKEWRVIKYFYVSEVISNNFFLGQKANFIKSSIYLAAGYKKRTRNITWTSFCKFYQQCQFKIYCSYKFSNFDVVENARTLLK